MQPPMAVTFQVFFEELADDENTFHCIVFNCVCNLKTYFICELLVSAAQIEYSKGTIFE